MTKLKAIKESIKHWERMIAWVKTQHPEDFTCTSYMRNAIQEVPMSNYCPLCKKYNNEKTIPSNHVTECPLGKKYGVCSDFRVKNKWRLVIDSLQWKEWLINANKLLRQLKSLLPKKGE